MRVHTQDRNRKAGQFPAARKLEADRVRLLALVALAVGALVLGGLIHAEGQAAHGSLHEIKASLIAAVDSL
ncbi:MAG: hypothetical protein P1U59_01815 [Alcanivorax sp.]|jgi:hypothetical protein|uniref:hypothetical protein n=1 Tax=Alcanivorax TaxID=59753 RepID=UPI0019AB07D7|nr:hypothetical protein [Alcanivorax sp.]MBD3643213.1 hypothetical protein [Alcanivorax sp.]MDF1723222.1 hypothetical protein [Alcanivorax sp.]